MRDVMSAVRRAVAVLTVTLGTVGVASALPMDCGSIDMDYTATGQITVNEGISRGTPPLRDFMLKQTRENDLKLFLELSKAPKPKSKEELPMTVVIPAYVISELKTGFQMGFFLFVPFLLVDIVVSTTLLSMGMLQLPPMMISLPFKVLLFVMIDGWNLLVGSLVRSFL